MYWKNLAACIVPLESCLNCFCGVKFSDSAGLSFLLMCIYMPVSSSPSSFTEYLNTLGEMAGFIPSHHCDVVVIVGDFNVDFVVLMPRCQMILRLIIVYVILTCLWDDVIYIYECDDI